MRWLFCILLIALFSCREIIPVETEEKISGYQINGSVTNQSGTPIQNVNVVLYYDTEEISDTQMDTATAFVTDTSQIVTVEIFNVNNILVKKIFFGKMNIGLVPQLFWNGLNDKGDEVVSGYYIMRYKIDSSVVKESPLIVDGHVSARTDSIGRFIISNDCLPVGKIYDRYLQNNFQGAYIISPSVVLTLIDGNLERSGRVYLNKNAITDVNITL
jgi:hypothetical protein